MYFFILSLEKLTGVQGFYRNVCDSFTFIYVFLDFKTYILFISPYHF